MGVTGRIDHDVSDGGDVISLLRLPDRHVDNQVVLTVARDFLRHFCEETVALEWRKSALKPR
jgi:hypothetical protein